MTSSRLASIDFGTNTARLLIAERRSEGIAPLLIERIIVRMGGGFSAENGLSAEAWARGMACLRTFADIVAAHEVSRVRAVATSAVRDAVNGTAFVEAVARETGLRLSVIDGTEEGRLTFAGVTAGLARRESELLVFDVGGGSTEYTYMRQGAPLFIRSLPIGVVRLTEGKGEPAAMTEKISRELISLRADMESSNAVPAPGIQLVGTAGTATTLAAISMEMTDYDYRRVNNALLGRDQIESIYQRLLPMSCAERLQVPGLEKGREDLIIAGMLITLETMKQFGCSQMTVSDYGLLEGLVVDGEEAGLMV